MSGSSWGTIRKHEKKVRSMNNGNLVFNLMLSLQIAPTSIYLALITIVLVKPEVMTLLGLQPFVDYVAYELQLNAYQNLVTQQLWEPGFEVYYFYMNAASMLIAGMIATVVCICVIMMAVLVPDVFYEYTKLWRRREMFWPRLVLFLLFVYALYHVCVGPATVNSRRDFYEFLLYQDVVVWITAFWVYYYLVTDVCTHIVMVRRRIYEDQ